MDPSCRSHQPYVCKVKSLPVGRSAPMASKKLLRRGKAGPGNAACVDGEPSGQISNTRGKGPSFFDIFLWGGFLFCLLWVVGVCFVLFGFVLFWLFGFVFFWGFKKLVEQKRMEDDGK